MKGGKHKIFNCQIFEKPANLGLLPKGIKICSTFENFPKILKKQRIWGRIIFYLGKAEDLLLYQKFGR